MIKRSRILQFMGRVFLALGIGFIAYFFIYRPMQLRWGASHEEVNRLMPGDEIVKNPSFNATRAVTVNKKPEQIWPWIVQIGHTRAGWYSYDLVDNLAKKSAERIIPELQNLQPGDLIPIDPNRKRGFWVKDFKPNQWMLWWDKEGGLTWAWGLYPLDKEHTRLVTRIRLRYNWLSPIILFAIAIDVGDFVMMRQCMLGIKARAEGKPVGTLFARSAEFVLWLTALIGFLIAEIRLVLRKNWHWPLVLSIFACSITILLVMWKPPIWCDALFTFVIYSGLWWSSRLERKLKTAQKDK